jgi:hypothetical protein
LFPDPDPFARRDAWHEHENKGHTFRLAASGHEIALTAWQNR